MKIIDTHNHVAPDKVARLTEEALFKATGMPLPAGNSFRADGLLQAMDRCGVDTALVFCVAERPAVEKKANDFVIELDKSNKRLVGLGSIHPDSEAYESEIERLKANGIRGIKVHSTFQDFYPDEARVMRIWRKLAQEDMILYFHTGQDVGKPPPGKAGPERIAAVMDAFPDLRIVAAHFGGLHMLEESRRWLLGKNVYFDMSWYPGMEDLDPEEIVGWIEAHGSDKILFATDYPTTDTRKQIEWANALPLSGEDKERIFYKNAQDLFGVSLE